MNFHNYSEPIMIKGSRLNTGGVGKKRFGGPVCVFNCPSQTPTEVPPSHCQYILEHILNQQESNGPE